MHGEDEPVEAAPYQARARVRNDIGDVFIVVVAMALEEYDKFDKEDHQVLR